MRPVVLLAVLGLGACEKKEPPAPNPTAAIDAGSADDDFGFVPIADDLGFVPEEPSGAEPPRVMSLAEMMKAAQAGTPSSSLGLTKPGRFKALVAPGGADGYSNFLWVVDTATGAVKGYRFAKESKGSWLVDQLDGPY